MTLRQRYGGPGRRAISRARAPVLAAPANFRCLTCRTCPTKAARNPAQAFMWVFMWAAECGARTSGPRTWDQKPLTLRGAHKERA
jgi:hypothetical protein